MTLTSGRVQVDLDVVSFTRFANASGWGDGLPLIPPTEDLVRRYVAAAGRRPDEIVASLTTVESSFSVEKIAINTAMSGAPEEAMPLICAAVAAMSDPAFDLAAQNATTASVVPALFVNGPIRHELDIPFGAGCFGGATGSGASIGRAVRLIMRNIAGQQSGRTSESVFGQPGRVSGIVIAEWEEHSPWAPLAERRGVPGDAVTVYGAMGTASIVELVAERGPDVLEVIGKSLAYVGANNFLSQAVVSEVAVALNPTWALEVIGRDLPDIRDVQQVLWDQASLPIDWFAAPHRRGLEAAGRVRAGGRVHLVPTPEDIIVLVCGGLGGLHATMLHCFSGTHSVTMAVSSP
jgi:hypothetical protein